MDEVDREVVQRAAAGTHLALVPKSEILKRTFLLKCGDELGTGFTLDINKRRYLITAGHVVGKKGRLRQVEVFWNQNWLQVQTTTIGLETARLDVAVLAPSPAIGPCLKLGYGCEGMVLGQDAYFIGFPGAAIGMGGIQLNPGPEFNGGYPIPFVKKGTIGGFHNGKIYLDGMANGGFSGGPVVHTDTAGETKVIGIVTSHVTDGGENTGIVVAEEIGSAIEMIRKKPRGTLERVCDRKCCDLEE